MKTIDFIRGKEWQVLNYFGFERTDLRHIDCPICGGKKKFRLNEHNGIPMYICVCGSGDTLKLLQEVTGREFKSLANEIDQQFGNTPDLDHRTEPKVNTRLEQAIARFREIAAIRGTDGELYLNNRGITQMPTGGVKWSWGEFNSDVDKKYPALYAIASNEYHEAIQRHLTYLDGDRKADVPKPKKMLSLQEYSGSVSVKLFQPASTLGIAEGIETALSAHQLYKLPVWSTLNATLMKKFKAPPGVSTLIVYADNDRNGTGLAAAFECGKSNLLANNDVDRVIIKWPELPDFNDMLLDGCKTYEWELRK